MCEHASVEGSDKEGFGVVGGEGPLLVFVTQSKTCRLVFPSIASPITYREWHPKVQFIIRASVVMES